MATTSNKLSNVPKPSYSDRIASDANLLYVSRSVGNVKQAMLVDMVYPVGSIYISVNTTNPGSLFGGTWEQIKDRFILAAGGSYTVGSTGGEATHKLTVNEMPSHRHSITVYASEDGLSGKTLQDAEQGKPLAARWNEYGSLSSEKNNEQRINLTGGGAAHNNMPPYLSVYMWKRTA